MKFIFDLDGTLTRQETLPLIAKHFNIQLKIDDLTNQTIKGNIPFVESFIRRANILSAYPVSTVCELISNMELQDEIIEFINENKKDCIIATGNFKGWIEGLVEKIDCPCYASNGMVKDDKLIKLTHILKKEEIVRGLQEQGEEVIFIGDGNNDVEAMRLANVSVACGIVHHPASSVLAIANYSVFSAVALCRLLTQIKSQQPGKSIVLSCAGTGSRLGLGQTKALINILGKPLIHWQLEAFTDVDDIRIVIGYQANEVIKNALEKKNDAIFVYNHDYFHTKTGASLYLGAKHANQYVIAWDGDLIVHSDDINACLTSAGEYIAGSDLSTEESVFVRLDENNMVSSFSRESGDFEWSGPACIDKARLSYTAENVFNQLEVYLPLPFLKIRAQDIDTYDDYKNAISFMGDFQKKATIQNSDALKYYDIMRLSIVNPLETRNKVKDFSSFDIELMMKFSDPKRTLLDLGSGTGLLINYLDKMFKKITAVDKYSEFTKFIKNSNNIEIINEDITIFRPSIGMKYDVVSLFGVMNFFNREEAIILYHKIFDWLGAAGMLVVKNQMGVVEDVTINEYSNELGTEYFSEYRQVDRETQLLQEVGFRYVEVIDVYPSEFNRFKNTHFYALVCRK